MHDTPDQYGAYPRAHWTKLVRQALFGVFVATGLAWAIFWFGVLPSNAADYSYYSLLTGSPIHYEGSTPVQSFENDYSTAYEGKCVKKITAYLASGTTETCQVRLGFSAPDETVSYSAWATVDLTTSYAPFDFEWEYPYDSGCVSDYGSGYESVVNLSKSGGCGGYIGLVSDSVSNTVSGNHSEYDAKMEIILTDPMDTDNTLSAAVPSVLKPTIDTPAHLSEITPDTINAAGSCPVGETPPNDGSCAFYFKVLSGIPYYANSTTDLAAIEWEIGDEEGNALCSGEESASQALGGQKASIFSPLVQGCDTFLGGLKYYVKVRSRYGSASTYSPWKSNIFRILGETETATSGYTEQSDGYYEKEIQTLPTMPVCRIIPRDLFWSQTATDDSTGFACVWEWVGWAVWPDESLFQPFFDLLNDLRDLRPTKYIFEINDALFGLLADETTTCPTFLTSDLPSTNDFYSANFDFCGMAEDFRGFMESERMKPFVLAAVSIGLISILVYGFVWFFK